MIKTYRSISEEKMLDCVRLAVMRIGWDVPSNRSFDYNFHSKSFEFHSKKNLFNKGDIINITVVLIRDVVYVSIKTNCKQLLFTSDNTKKNEKIFFKELNKILFNYKHFRYRNI